MAHQADPVRGRAGATAVRPGRLGNGDALSGARCRNSLQPFEALRTVNVEIMRRMTEVDWSRKFRHREFGTVPIRVLIEHISDHDLAHLRQIKGM